MKRFFVIASLLVVSFQVLSMGKGPGINHNCIHVISMADNMFYFKSDKDVSSANIEVYSHRTGEKVLSQVIEVKHTTVNFQNMEAGDYIILITKGEFRRKYVYHKRG